LGGKNYGFITNTAGSRKNSWEAIRGQHFLGHELACQISQEDNFLLNLSNL
jgi:hypothetical protein